MADHDPLPPPRTFLGRLLRPLVAVLALIYFLIDALVYWVVRPLAAWIGRWAFFPRFAAWVAGLGRYPTLALFLVPLVILEPAKPVGGWLIATGHPIQGGLVLAVAEVLKLTLVERLFHLCRDKLLTIPAFAWVYWRAVAVLDWVKALPPWQAAARLVARLRDAARRIAVRIRGWVRSVG